MKRDKNQNEEEGQPTDSLERQGGPRRTARLVVTQTKRRKCDKFDPAVFRENSKDLGRQGSRGTEIS